MKIDWSPLRKSLSLYRQSRVALPIWWRDDDAVTASPALERLHDLSLDVELAVHIAVIPDQAQKSLAASVAQSSQLVPLAHGWRHKNHAALNAKKAEFGTYRPEGLHEFENGLSKLRMLFGRRLVLLFVPPWNRFDPAHHKDLIDAGYRGISLFGPRQNRFVAPKLLQINTHVDPVFWRGTRDLKDPEVIINEVVSQLERRLRSETDATEPLGYLTHHLVHSEKLWEFSRQFLSEFLQGGAEAQPIAPLLETQS